MIPPLFSKEWVINENHTRRKDIKRTSSGFYGWRDAKLHLKTWKRIPKAVNKESRKDMNGITEIAFERQLSYILAKMCVSV